MRHPASFLRIKNIAILLLLSLCCKSEKKNLSEPLPENPIEEETVNSQTSAIGILEVLVDLSDSGIKLSVKKIPDAASLECHLDDKSITPCHDGALFKAPTPGDHKITVTAIKNGSVVSVGESEPFTVGFGQVSVSIEDAKDKLALSLLNPDFVRGMPLPVSKPYRFDFKMISKPDCNAEIFCKYGNDNNEFWTLCDEVGKPSFLIEGEMMAMGRQSLSVQARCQDRVGPILSLHWYGVTDDYESLKLRSINDSMGKTFVFLMKSDDCPPSQLNFECSEANSPDDWALCPSNNVLEFPKAGMKIRASCDGRKGPGLVIGTTNN